MKGAMLLVPWVLFSAGCATSQVPQAIREAPPQQITVLAVQQDTESFLGQRMRWGGTIIAVRNRERTTDIEVLSRSLRTNGEPRAQAPGEGRFIARLPGFADPAEFPEKRLLTVTGPLAGVETRAIGEYPYAYPVVSIEGRYLWPEPLPQLPPYYYRDPWYYPWYRPWHPWYGPWYY